MDFVSTLIDSVEKISRTEARRSEPALIYGEVKSVSPLKIKVKDSYEIDEAFIVLDARCVETWINIPKHDEYEHDHDESEELENILSASSPAGPVTFVTDQGGGTSIILRHKHKIQKALPKILLWRGLKTGDKVRILRLTGGSIHIVLERVEGITNDPED
jgi:DMSO/TMAO reductase YedYZ molybdopterin-dependent catalytic subunit